VTNQVAAVGGGALDEGFVEARDDFSERKVAVELGLERSLGHCGEQRWFRQAGIKRALDRSL